MLLVELRLLCVVGTIFITSWDKICYHNSYVSYEYLFYLIYVRKMYAKSL